jgi:hypothetical protein
MLHLFETKMRKALRAIQDLGNAKDEYYSLFNKKPYERTDDHQELLASARKKMDDLSDRVQKGRQRQEYKMIRNEILGKKDEVGEDEGTATSKLHALNADIISSFAGAHTLRRNIAGIPKDINIPGKAEEYGIKLHGDVPRNRELIVPFVKHMELNHPLEVPRLLDAANDVFRGSAANPASPLSSHIFSRNVDHTEANKENLRLAKKAIDQTPGLAKKYMGTIKAIQRSELNTNLSRAGMSPEKFTPLTGKPIVPFQ